ncbi:hypothetical protein BS78_K111800 [Paspalum vaginatum]|uniref:Uncharacterized protein n=1 Tax=Paspalum vaginatum TaxID=158149 RepID=A0A9W8CDV9_9POAL|nr:hypothetical protein BS78_K111800 [Paspalum vaginatum]
MAFTSSSIQFRAPRESLSLNLCFRGRASVLDTTAETDDTHEEIFSKMFTSSSDFLCFRDSSSAQSSQSSVSFFSISVWGFVISYPLVSASFLLILTISSAACRLSFSRFSREFISEAASFRFSRLLTSLSIILA